MALTNNLSNRHRVVIAGGGVAALEALVSLRTQAPELIDVTIVCPADSFGYRAADVDEPFGRGAARRYALAPIAADLDASLVRDALTEVAADRTRVILRSGRQLQYDSLVVALGAQRYPAFANGVSFDRERDPAALDELLADIDTRFVEHVALVVPEGVEWTLPAYQLALSIAAFGRRPLGRELNVTLVTHEPAPLAAFGATVSRSVREALAAERVKFVLGARGVVVDEHALVAGSKWVTADRIVALPQVAGPRPRGVPCDSRGFIPTDRHGRVPGLDGVYAAGDGTDYPIKQGGLAAQQADAVAAHILFTAGLTEAAAPFEPVLRGMLQDALGPLYLKAELGSGRAAEGAVASRHRLWHPAGRVASRWLGPYLDGVGDRPALPLTQALAASA
jgi:sulfide:quinone oxidoreductase